MLDVDARAWYNPIHIARYDTKIDKMYIKPDSAAFFIELVFDKIEVSKMNKIANAQGLIESAKAAGARISKKPRSEAQSFSPEDWVQLIISEAKSALTSLARRKTKETNNIIFLVIS